MRKHIFAHIEEKRVDVIVVYKVDRLTRSLSDFSKMVDLFDRHSVSFVAVTQQFNTTTSMGRLTLNVLAKYSREELASLVFNSMQHARMRIPSEHRAWVFDLIGEERARKCTCFPRSFSEAVAPSH